MDGAPDMTEDDGRLLYALAKLSLAMASDLRAAVAATDNAQDIVRLAGAFAKVGRCLRLTVALRARLAHGEALVAATRAEARPDTELAEEADRSEDERIHSERHEGPDRESLYERLPDGDPGVIARGLAQDLIQTARTLRAPKDRGAKPIMLSRDYETLCRDLVANDPEPPDTLPLAAAARGPP